MTSYDYYCNSNPRWKLDLVTQGRGFQDWDLVWFACYVDKDISRPDTEDIIASSFFLYLFIILFGQHNDMTVVERIL